MTLVVACKCNDFSVILSDFRTTIRNSGVITRQFDHSLKLARSTWSGIFLSGDFASLRPYVASLLEILDEIGADEILDVSTNARLELNAIAVRCNGGACGGIAFLLRPQSGSHYIFRIEIVPGQGILVEPCDSTKSVGRGASVGGFNEMIARASSNLCASPGHRNPYEFASSLRADMRTFFANKGIHIYRAAGFSPYFSASILEGAHFRLCGEEIQGFHVHAGHQTEYRFLFHSIENGRILFTDNISGEAQEVLDIDDIDLDTPGDVFDPEGILSQKDYVGLYPDADHVYLFSQVPTPCMGNPPQPRIYRSLTRLTFLDGEFREIVRTEVAVRFKVADSADELRGYRKIVSHDFVVEDWNAFEENLEGDVFDDSKLKDAFVDIDRALYNEEVV